MSSTANQDFPPAYLPEGIQDYGYLLIVNTDLRLVSISENCSSWTGQSVQESLGQRLEDFITAYLSENYSNIQKGVYQVLQDPKERVWLEVRRADQEYYLNVYQDNQYVFLEFENKSLDNNVFFPKFENFNRLLRDNKDRIWEVLCGYISQISGFDRIRVFQYDEDENGIIVAESIENPELESILHCYYPDIDVFRFAKKVHSINTIRYTAKVDAPTIRIVTNGEDMPVLDKTSVRMVLPLHAAYLLKDGVNSNLSMSILIDGKLWGYIFCQSKEPRKINLLKREAMISFIQMAVSCFTEEQRKRKQERYEIIRDFELLLKERLLLTHDLSEILNELGDQLCDFSNSDAMVLVYGSEMYSHKMDIGQVKVKAIVDQISRLTDSDYFADHEFVLKYGRQLGLNFQRFAGVAAVMVEPEKKLTVLFFKKEETQQRKWVEKPEELMAKNHGHIVFEHEPHAIFDIWHQTTFRTSQKWCSESMSFFRRFRDIIIESYKILAQEISLLNAEVLNLNKALDDYANTVSHDLKNPLSAINLSTQMLIQKPDMPVEIRQKLLKNTKEAVAVITEMLSSIHEFSKVKSFDYKLEPVYTNEFIPQIVNFSKIRYRADRTEVQFGTLMPLYGEKTIIYQLFQNLIGNAVKYSAKVNSPKLIVYSELDHEFVRFYIVDNGIGMAKEELKNVFDSFKRLSNATDFEGTGLGLSIVKRIVDRLNVQIVVDSEIGRGTTIQLLFPNEY